MSVTENMGNIGRHYTVVEPCSTRTPCSYGADCYRDDAEHWAKYSHPCEGPKPQCKFGAACHHVYVDAEHAEKFAHPLKERPECAYGAQCRRKDPQHMSRFSHTSASETLADEFDNVELDKVELDELPPCAYGLTCIRKDPEHLAAFSHPASKPPCKYGALCHQRNTEHLEEYSHPLTQKPECMDPKCHRRDKHHLKQFAHSAREETRSETRLSDVSSCSQYESQSMPRASARSSVSRPKEIPSRRSSSCLKEIPSRQNSSCSKEIPSRQNSLCTKESRPKEDCHYGMSCTKLDDEKHTARFDHPRNKAPCKYGILCTNSSEQHSEKYAHPPKTKFS